MASRIILWIAPESSLLSINGNFAIIICYQYRRWICIFKFFCAVNGVSMNWLLALLSTGFSLIIVQGNGCGKYLSLFTYGIELDEEVFGIAGIKTKPEHFNYRDWGGYQPSIEQKRSTQRLLERKKKMWKRTDTRTYCHVSLTLFCRHFNNIY